MNQIKKYNSFCQYPWGYYDRLYFLLYMLPDISQVNSIVKVHKKEYALCAFYSYCSNDYTSTHDIYFLDLVRGQHAFSQERNSLSEDVKPNATVFRLFG